VLPFLQQQGVNQIDWAFALDSQPRHRSGWLQMLASLPIKTFYDRANSQSSAGAQDKDATVSSSAIAGAIESHQGKYQQLSPGQTLSVGSTPIELINVEPLMLRLQIRDQIWLLVGEIQPDIQVKLVKTGNLPRIQVLWWSGGTLTPELLEALQPKVAIASSNAVDSETAQLLRNAKIPLYWTGRDGAVQWTPNGGFETALETINSDAPLL
jgi:competence protein ComEC